MVDGDGESVVVRYGRELIPGVSIATPLSFCYRRGKLFYLPLVKYFDYKKALKILEISMNIFL